MSNQYNEEAFLLGMNYILNEGKRVKKLSEKMMDLILCKRENLIMKKENTKDIKVNFTDKVCIYKPTLIYDKMY